MLLSAVSQRSAPSTTTFVPRRSNSSVIPHGSGRSLFEIDLLETGCYNPNALVDGNDFGQLLYQIAVRENPVSPLSPKSLTNAVELLFSTTFSIFASTVIFQPMNSSLSVIGTYWRKETRLVVVSPVAYIILAVLCAVAIMIIPLFSYGMQESILYEEPSGLLSFAGLLYDSSILTIVKALRVTRDFSGRLKEAAKKEGFLNDETERYGMDGTGRIVLKPSSSP
jgi:hypothetical protein